MHLIDHPAAAPASVVAAFREDLAEADSSTLTDAERIDMIAELERLKAGAAAAQARLTAAFESSQRGAHVGEGGHESEAWRRVGSQVGLARRISPTRGDDQVTLAWMLTGDLPCTMAALERGDISEWTATVVSRELAVLSPELRREVDRRLAPDLARLSTRQLAAAARRAVAELDAAALLARMTRAVRSRRVTVRPAPDGMAYLSILAPLTDAVGAFASLRQHAEGVIAGAVEGDTAAGPDGELRGLGAIMTDTALRRITGRAPGQAQPVAVQLVMTDRALTGWGDPERSVDEPALIPGHGPVPARFARDLLGDPEVEAFYRRLFTSPDGRDLIALDARSRCFPTGLRSMVVLRDQRCRTPFCDAPIADIDHIRPHRAGGPTSYRNGLGLCRRCNLTKETPGYRVTVHVPPDAGQAPGAHAVTIATPVGQRVTSVAPPLLGWGWRAPPDDRHMELESPGERRLRHLLAA